MTSTSPTEQDPAQLLTTSAAAVGRKVEAAMEHDLSSVLNTSDPLLKEIIHYAVFSGGKRIRPLLAILSARLCGRDDPDLYRLATAFEYLHVASLIHDDIIDHAPQRRGRASLVEKYDFASAILAGDWLLSRSMRLVGELSGAEGLAVFCRATEGMVDGEFLQLRCVAAPETTEQEYFRIIECKTGNLIASTCELGALYAGANAQQRQALAVYGDKIGAAFQVIDDLLDYQGNEEETGKAVGNDFVEGKVTLPLIHALQRADAPSRQKIAGLLSGDRTNPSAYNQIVDLIRRFDGFATAEKTAHTLVREAGEALQLFARASDQTSLSILHALSRYVLTRRK